MKIISSSDVMCHVHTHPPSHHETLATTVEINCTALYCTALLQCFALHGAALHSGIDLVSVRISNILGQILFCRFCSCGCSGQGCSPNSRVDNDHCTIETQKCCFCRVRQVVFAQGRMITIASKFKSSDFV